MDHIHKNKTEEIILPAKSRNIRNTVSNFKYDSTRMKSMVELFYMKPDSYENNSDGKLLSDYHVIDEMTRFKV